MKTSTDSSRAKNAHHALQPQSVVRILVCLPVHCAIVQIKAQKEMKKRDFA
ncbi:hypothetical protein KIN20_037948 [Parelaphostrongylus tenuis]|uniref:Uncharacterized protein n=1 Tax=Parelaphostrongylus tenuis TaxID=148309 RepID=A0AAD5REY1_PARTN|nr:hypothetical protein KIN20_037948 [Parelaphostrongylus tenuis]